MSIDKEIVRNTQNVLGALFTLGQNRWGWTLPHFFQIQKNEGCYLLYVGKVCLSCRSNRIPSGGNIALLG